MCGIYKSTVDVAANDDVVTMTFRYKCKEVWESDPSYSDGGFWFLGYDDRLFIF